MIFLYSIDRRKLTVKRIASYDEIKTVEGFKHQSFRERYFAMTSLQDDHEFIEAIKEAYNQGSNLFLHKIFVTMFLLNNLGIIHFFDYIFNANISSKTFISNNFNVDLWCKTNFLIFDIFYTI